MGIETLAVVGAIGAVTSAVGQVKSGKAARKAAEYNAQVSEKNAQQALEKARQDEKLFRVQADKQIGSATAARGASGIRATGSFQQIMAESFNNIEEDARNIQLQGTRQAESFREEGRLATMQGRAAESNSKIGAAGTLLSGAASLGAGLTRK